MTDTLKDRLIRLIESGGPMPISSFMQYALHDATHGYYATRPGIGRDFITAPETSQIFGELIGLWCVHEWTALGKPGALSLAELGPGRAALMSDALRFAYVAGGPEFADVLTLTLIEVSPKLRAAQADKLKPYAPKFMDALTDIPAGHTLILANEYLDCLPARQFRKTGDDWHECVVGLDADQNLTFGLAGDRHGSPIDATPTDTVVEVQPALDLLVAELSLRAADGDKFHALLIDYGPSDKAPGDTLRAYKDGLQIGPLDQPGDSDLTVDVDFSRLKRLAEAAGLTVSGPIPQGMFLLGMGAQARLSQLVKANPDHGEDIFNAAQRLIDPKDMGERFKVICLSSPGLPVPAGF
jgi:NADH dehydrogenase [ubiquinone] 1 alpha subcomplex assembly factor 7